MSYPNLNLLLHAANRRELLLGWARVGLQGVSVLLVGLLLAVALDAVFALPAAARLVLDAALLAVVLWMLGKLLQVVRRGRFDPRRVARSLEDRLGMTSNTLINAVELRGCPASSASRRLAELAIEQGEAAARQVDVQRAIASAPARRTALMAGLAAGVTMLAFLLMPAVFTRGLPRLVDPTGDHPPFTLVRFDVETQPQPLFYGASAVVAARVSGPVMPVEADLVFAHGDKRQRLPMIETDEGYRLDLQRVRQSRRFYIDTPQGRSDWYELSVQQVPLIEELWVAYRYPAHTERPPRRYRLTSDKIEALTGTEVSLEAVSNYPLSAARVEFFAGDPSPSQPHQKLLLRPDAQSAPRVRGAFRLTQSGRLTLRLVGANQQLGPELREIPLVALDDQPPQVALVDPEPLALAVEGWKVPLKVDATDDFQVTDLQVHYRFDGQPSQSVKLTTGGSDRRQRQGQAELDLAQLAAKAGDRIQVSATAADNHPSGGQVGASPLHRIEVISHDQYLDHLRSVYQLQEMSDEIAAVNERLDELAQQRQQLLDEIDALHQSLTKGQPFDVQQQQQSRQLKQELERHSEQMQEFAGQLDERLAAPQLYDAEQAYRQQLEALAEQLERQRDDVDDLQETLEALSRDGKPGAEELERLRQAREQLRRSTEPLTKPEATGLAESQRQVEKLVQADRMLQELERIEGVVDQQRELADRFQTLEPAPRPSADQQRRTDQLAREQERLNQELEEAQRALRKVAEDAKKTLPRTSTDACRLCDSIGQAGISGDQQEAARAARQGAVPQAQQSARQAADKLQSLAAQGPKPGASDIGSEWSPDDLDRGLRLSPQGVERTLQQLARAQSSRPLASGRSDAQAEAHGRSAGRSRVGLHGPRPPDQMFAARRGRRTQQSLRGGVEPSGDEPVGEAETIDATARSADLDAAGNVRGVPVGYRDQAEAYFRRLAEEAAGEPTESDQ